MATQAKISIRPFRTASGGDVEVRYFPEAASQSFKKGEAVYIDGSGYLAEFTASVDDGSTLFLGFAAEDAHNDTTAATHRTGVWMGNSETEFIGSLYHVTDASAVSAITDVLAANPYPLYMDTANSICQVDKGDTANQIHCCLITQLLSDIDSRQAVGDKYAHVIFKLVPSAMQGGYRSGEATE